MTFEERRAEVFNNGVLAGVLEEKANGYRFTYDPSYLSHENRRAVSLTLPKRSEPYNSKHLFPFFYGLLAEGSTKELQCKTLKLDENDHFGRLIKTACYDTIGSVTVKEQSP